MRYQKLCNKNKICTFVDFKKLYDSTDHNFPLQILKEQGLNFKTLSIIKATLAFTKSEVKFTGEIYEPYKIKTRVKQKIFSLFINV